MAISLKKGSKIDLTKGNPSLNNLLIGLGWDTNKYDGQKDFDLDASAFCVEQDGKTKEKNFVFYGNLKAPGIEHTGDNLTGVGDGDDEVIKVALKDIPAEIEKVAFTVTIYDAQERNQTFGQVSNAYIRVVNADTNEELARYDLEEDFSVETALVVAEIYRHNGEWKFSAIGSGFQGGLEALCRNYGLDV